MTGKNVKKKNKMDVLDKFFTKYSYKFPKGYPDMNDPKDKKMLFEIAYGLVNEEEIEKIEDINVDVILDPKQEPAKIEDTKDELSDLLKTVKEKSKKDKIKSYIQNLEYIDKVNHYLDKKNFDDIEEILVKAFISRNDQYKIFYEYLPKMIDYNSLPSSGNLISIFEKFGFDNQFLNDLIKRDYQAGGKGVGPGELF